MSIIYACVDCIYKYGDSLECTQCISPTKSYDIMRPMCDFYGREVIAKTDSFWYIGNIEHTELNYDIFMINNWFDKISDIKDIDSYITLKEFMTRRDMFVDHANELLKQFDVSMIYLQWTENDKDIRKDKVI